MSVCGASNFEALLHGNIPNVISAIVKSLCVTTPTVTTGSRSRAALQQRSWKRDLILVKFVGHNIKFSQCRHFSHYWLSYNTYSIDEALACVQLVAIKLSNLSPTNCPTCRHQTCLACHHQTVQLVAIKLSNVSPSNCSTCRHQTCPACRHQIVQLVAIKLSNMSPSNLSSMSPSNCPTCRHQTVQLVAVKLPNLSPSNCPTCRHQTVQLVAVKLPNLSP
jgi:hypothetical protein